MISRFVSWFSKYNDPLLNEGNILSFGDDLSGGSIKKKKTLISFLKHCPQDHLQHSYYDPLHDKTSTC